MTMQWFLKAAERGNVRAQHRVGLAYETARGVGKDIGQALSWCGAFYTARFVVSLLTSGSQVPQGSGQ